MINKLADCGVVFNEEHHTYTYEGKELRGITPIISKYLFPNQYANVSESVLEAARERGSMVHSGLEMEFNGISSDTPEVVAYRELAKKNKIKQIAAEYIVSDCNSVATCIDNVAYVNGERALIDYKTTATLNIEYLRWQLSIEACLFEGVNMGLPITRLYAIHLPKPKDGVCEAKLVEIERLPAAYVCALLDAFKCGSEHFDNPLTSMDAEFDNALEQYRQADEALADLKDRMKYYEEIQAQYRQVIKEKMDTKGIAKLERADVRVTRSADKVRKTFDLQMLKEQCPKFPAKWMKEIENKGYKESKVAGRLTITLN